MKILILDTAEKVGDYAARHVIKRIQETKPTEDNPFVLGLPTGL